MPAQNPKPIHGRVAAAYPCRASLRCDSRTDPESFRLDAHWCDRLKTGSPAGGCRRAGRDVSGRPSGEPDRFGVCLPRPVCPLRRLFCQHAALAAQPGRAHPMGGFRGSVRPRAPPPQAAPEPARLQPPASASPEVRASAQAARRSRRPATTTGPRACHWRGWPETADSLSKSQGQRLRAAAWSGRARRR